MLKLTVKGPIKGSLSDKDLQLIKKTYCKLTELYYQNTKNESSINDLINLGSLIVQVISSKKQSDTLSLTSIMEILKVKSKSKPELIAHIDLTVDHLKNPKQNTVKYDALIYGLQRSDLFVVACTVGIRFFQKINCSTSEFDWKTIIGELSRNISISPALCIEFLYEICRQNQLNSRLVVKSGLVKFLFLSYISSTIEDKLHLYKSIKLLKVIANAERSILKDKEKPFALIIYAYQDYIPVIEEICSKCYDFQYCSSIDSKRKFDQNTIDQPYLWSYTQAFMSRNISDSTVEELIKNLQTQLNEERQTKTFAILANFTKFKKIILKVALQMVPKNEKALLNFIKLCVSSCQIDHSSGSLINFANLQLLVDKSPNPKVSQLFKYLKQLRNKDTKIGALNQNILKMFDMQKNADFMMERASKIPQNNEELLDIKQILKQKDRTNEFESDTLKTVKQRALNSLQIAVIQKRKLDLNIILKQINLSDVKLLSKLLQILQLLLMMNDDLIQTIDTDRVMMIIQWIEQNYNGELIEWGSIGQLIIILKQEGQWKRHVKELPEQCFWLLGIQELKEEEQTFLFNKVKEILNYKENYLHKIPFLIGFLGRVLSRQQKLKLYSNFSPLLELMQLNIKNNVNHKINLLMISFFFKNWHSSEISDQQSNKIFESIIEPTVSVVLSNFRSIEQQYELLQNVLPYKQKYGALNDNLDYLISLYGRLASYVYKSSNEKINISYDRIKALGRIAPEKSRNILQILNFLEQNSEIMQQNQLTVLLDNLMSKKMVYWCVYPNFYNIISKMLSIMSKTSNSVITADINTMITKLISFIAGNLEISPQQKNQIYQKIKQTLQSLRDNQKINIDKERLKKVVGKINNKQLQDELMQLISSFKIIEQIEQKVVANTKKNEEKMIYVVPQTVNNNQPNQISPNKNQKGVKISDIDDNKEDLNKREETVDIEGFMNKLASNDIINLDGDITVIQALRELRKIIDKVTPQNKWTKLNQIFLKLSIKYEEMDILGYLLIKFYSLCTQQYKEQVLNLLLMKDKTHLSKDNCFELLSKYKQTFILSKRWKLIGREWLDLAMVRLSQGMYSDASQVVEYNVIKTAELEYFYSKKYHQIVLQNYFKIKDINDFSHYFVMIGTVARISQIKQYFYKEKLHTQILSSIFQYDQNSKIIANILYALSALVYLQNQACLDLVRQKTQMQHLLKAIKNQIDNKAIIQSGACLITNLAYSSQQTKQSLRLLNITEILLNIFENTLQNPELSTFRQLLRALGNLSLSSKLTQQMIDQHFCALAVRMVQKLDVFVHFDDKKAGLMKILIDLISNLASHRYKLDLFHKQKLTLMILTLLETTESYPAILTACIDTIDCLCQNAQIQNYVVTQKKIPYLLIDVLKIQTDQKIVVKSTRLLTNLTINQTCIPYILEANLLSVLANIVMPHFYGNKLAAEQNKKMETYILKIITRIYHSKQSKQLILKSGYLDCLVRTIETADNIEDAFIQIMYSLSEFMPSFLNKRAFICLIRVLTKKIQNKQITNKCLKTIKNLSTIYDRDEEDVVIQNTAQMYQKLLIGEIKDDGLYLLALHLLRSHKLRQTLQKKTDQVLEIVKKISEDVKYIDICREIYFLVYNPITRFQQTQEKQNQSLEMFYNSLKKGFKCNLFRIDGSSKKAIIDINQQYQIRSYKYPDGQIKKKYTINIKNLKDFQVGYQTEGELWNASVFNLEKGLLFDKKINAKNCCTLIGNAKWGEFSFINIQFQSVQDKNRFFVSLSHLFNSLR